MDDGFNQLVSNMYENQVNSGECLVLMNGPDKIEVIGNVYNDDVCLFLETMIRSNPSFKRVVEVALKRSTWPKH